jgi:hypothetical protein
MCRKLTDSQHSEEGVYNDQPFGKQSRVSHSISQNGWPQVPHTRPVSLTQYTLYKARDKFQRGALSCFSKGGVWLKDWLREWFNSRVYLWFLLISLRLLWLPPWAFRIHPTSRHHHSSKDGLNVCVW